MSNGGPAFSRPKVVIPGMKTIDEGSTGMSLRDYLAIHASHDDLSLPETAEQAAKLCGIPVAEYGAKQWVEIVCRARYEFADAMIAAREVKP